MTNHLVLFAQEGQAAQPPAGDPAAKTAQGPSTFGFFFPLVAVALLYFVVILPMNRRQRREQEAKINSVKRGTKVATASGIVGTVISAKDGEAEIVIRSEDAKIRILRSAVANVLGQDETETK